jgi:hypothetical protein
MPLIDCPACGHQISVEADACPQCGHPNRQVEYDPSEPSCYTCSAPATTRCMRCNRLSCVRHVQSVHVRYNRGEGHELLCKNCRAWIEKWQKVGWIVAGILITIMLFAFLWGVISVR